MSIRPPYLKAGDVVHECVGKQTWEPEGFVQYFGGLAMGLLAETGAIEPSFRDPEAWRSGPGVRTTGPRR